MTPCALVFPPVKWAESLSFIIFSAGDLMMLPGRVFFLFIEVSRKGFVRLDPVVLSYPG